MKIKIAALFIFSSVLFAQSAESFLNGVREKYRTVKSLSADFEQNTGGNSNTAGTVKGKFYYQQKNKFIVEFENQTIISDGNTIWNYNKKSKQVIISSAAEESPFLSIDRLIYDYPSQCTVNVEKGSGKDSGYTIMRLVPKKDDIPFKNIKVWVDRNYLVRKLELINLNGLIFSIGFSGIELNKNFTKMNFVFNPPKGVRVIDLR